jgi:fatty acid desaturase
MIGQSSIAFMDIGKHDDGLFDSDDTLDDSPPCSATHSDAEEVLANDTGHDAPSLIDAKTLHMVRGRYYDLSEFDHPGGRLVLEQGRGEDITAAVASHHFTEAPYRAMRKYEVPPSRVLGTIRPGGYSFKEDGFHAVLKRRVVQLVAPQGNALKMRQATQPSVWYQAHVVGCLSLYALSWGWCCFGTTFSWVAALVAMCTRTSLVGIGHEAVHGRLSGSLFYLFGMVLCHPSEKWHLDHVIQHHPHTKREGLDPDETGLAPVLRLNRYTEWGPWHVVQILLQIVISFFFSVALWVEHSFLETVVFRRPKYFLSQTASLLVFQLLPFLVATHGHAFRVVCLVVGMSNVLTLHAFHVSHINEQNEMDDDAAKNGMDWGEWQCRTSSNWDSNWELTGMLEYQIEHHLFPSLPYATQKQIRPLVRKTCEEFGIPYFEYPSMSNGIYHHIKYLVELSLEGWDQEKVEAYKKKKQGREQGKRGFFEKIIEAFADSSSGDRKKLD